MSDFQLVINKLVQRIQQSDSSQVRCSEYLSAAPASHLIDWLDAQPIFPKFYWQSRDGQEEVVALGVQTSFSEPGIAYGMLAPKQRIWGGRGFDGAFEPQGTGDYFFLPSVELMRKGERWQLTVNTNVDRQAAQNTLAQLTTKIKTLECVRTHIISAVQSPSFPQWQELLQNALHTIANGGMQKVVLARETRLTLATQVSAAQFLKDSIGANLNSYHFLLAFDANNAFIGSPPERLYRREQRQLMTEALAGTIGRGTTPQEDAQLSLWLSQDEKNIKENQFVVDDILERLAPISRHIEVEPKATLVKLRKVQHLRRLISAHINDEVNGVQLLGALQPTAAVAGLPRAAALAFIHQFEPFERRWYAGSMGYISHEQAEFCVAIRCALFRDGGLSLYAGAGIIPGSVATEEWQELDKKTATLLSLLTDNEVAE